MAITSQDIAKLAGVSRSAVSAVLNGHYNKVSVRKKEMILAIAQDLRYRPNPVALMLAHRKTMRIGIIAQPFLSGITSDLTGKLSFHLKERGYTASVALPLDAKQELEAFQDFESFGVDGIIVLYAVHDVRTLNLRVPVVSMSPYPGQFELRVDLQYAFELAVRHFREHRHEKIGFLCPRLSVVPMQWEGYAAAVSPAPAYVLEVTGNPDTAGNLAALIDREGVRAWTVTNDLLAARMMRHLLDAGYRIPEEVALIGFDGASFADVTPSPMTTVVFPADDIARRCVDLLFEKIARKDTAFHSPPEWIRPTLHLGESCGCRKSEPFNLVWDHQDLTLDRATAST